MVYEISDTHCHITCDRLYEHIDELLQNAKEHHIKRMLVVCTNFLEYERAQRLKEEGHPVDIALGFHPNDLRDFNDRDYERLNTLASEHKLDAIGEIGLDYHYEDTDIELQKNGFERQIHIAKMYNLPILIHMRDATKDTLDMLQAHAPCKGIMHCYSGSYESAKIATNIGLYISFGGPLTFKNSRGLPEVASKLSIDHLLIETDCPYLTPHPFRGTQNEPMYLTHTFEKLCEIKNVSEETLAQILERNYQTLFKRE